MGTHSKYITAMTIPLLAFVIMSMGLADTAYAHKADVVGDYKIEIGWDNEPPIQGIKNSIELVVTHATESDRKQAEKMQGTMTTKNSMNNQMNMNGHDMKNYVEKIIPILNQFDSEKITSFVAISQISKIIDEQKPDDISGKEIKNLVDDAQLGVIPDDDTLYTLIDMLGTVMPNKKTESMQMMDHSNMAHNEESLDNANNKGEGVSGLQNTIQISVTVDDHTSTIPISETHLSGMYLGEFTSSSTGYPIVHISGMIHDTKVDLDMHPEEVESLSILPPLKQVSRGIDPSDVQCKDGLELFMRVNQDSAICASSEAGQQLMELGIVDYY